MGICIDLSSTNGGNFCSVTGQDDWCSSEMACHGDQNDVCQVEHWCVCQWAFASYIEKAGGCDAIQEIVCDAINIEAIFAYQEQAKQTKYQNALDCLVERCGLNTNSLKVKNYLHSKRSSKWILGGALITLSLIGMAFLGSKKIIYNSIDSKEVLLNPQGSISNVC